MGKTFNILLLFPIKYCEYPSVKCLFSVIAIWDVKAIVILKELLLSKMCEKRKKSFRNR